MTMFDQPRADPAPPTRIAAIRAVLVAIGDCQEDDLRMILSAILEEICAGAPAPGFEGIEAEAQNWAALASYDELRAWFFACGERLTTTGLGPRGRMRLASRLMAGLSVDERATVLRDLDSAPGPERAPRTDQDRGRNAP